MRGGERWFAPARSLHRSLPFVLALLVLLANSASADPPSFFKRYCFECHDEGSAKAGLNLVALSAARPTKKTSDRWEQVLKRVRSGEMPPVKATQPSKKERRTAVSNLHQWLIKRSKSDGVLRRLSTSEYKNSIESLLGIDFKVPDEFPADTVRHGFDNSAAGLLVSPALLECYFDAATQAADRLFPPGSGTGPRRLRAGPKDFAFAEVAARVVGKTIRLVARTGRISDSCIWPAKFEATTPGKYKVTIAASRFAPGSKAIPSFKGPMKLRVYAWRVDQDESRTIGTMRKLNEFQVTSDNPKSFAVEIQLRRGEAPVLYFANALISRPTDRPPKDFIHTPDYGTLLRGMLTRDKRLFAAWRIAKLDDGLQRGSSWSNLKQLRDSKALKRVTIDNSKEEVDRLVNKMVKKIGFVDPVINYQLFEEGPALQIHSLEIVGPIVAERDKQEGQRKKLVSRFMAAAPARASPMNKVRPIMAAFLSKAFRRPATDRDVKKYSSIVISHVNSGHSLEEGLHLAIRTALISPHFLYRNHRPGQLDDWDLAARMSYFLTGAPPDDRLIAVTAAGNLSKTKQFAKQANRLIDSNEVSRFVTNFTGQWLGLRRLTDIKPDPRLMQWHDGHRDGMIGESERFFEEIVKKNRPLQTFIQPDFTWGNRQLLNDIYGLNVKVTDGKFTRIKVPKGARFGGLLGQAGILMATSNGNQTQPVVRGVWVLRNILGDPPAPPPPGTPTIEPDTRGTRTVRELMAAHTADARCASCHRKIDPIGFVLENYDPLGRWRTHYPKWAKSKKGKPIMRLGAAVDPVGDFPGGAKFKSVSDLRKYVVTHIDEFGVCLSEKLMTYAIGRRPNYAERAEIAQIVRANVAKSKNGAGFRDLLLQLIQSRAFRTR